MYIPAGMYEVSRILSKSDKFLIYYDPDIDGAISGELVRRFLVRFSKPFLYYINENRLHGMKMTDEQLRRLVGFTMLLVDSAISKDELQKLVDMGINVINIDHHNIDEESLVHVTSGNGCEGVIVNNQYPFEPEKYRFLSGAGVVYYVLNALYPGIMGEDEKALVGLSLLSDVRPIENNIAADFLRTLYTHRSPMMEYLVSVVDPGVDFGFGERVLDRNFVDYTFAPRINALFRVNRGEEAISIFRGDFSHSDGLEVFRGIQNAMVDFIIGRLYGEEYSNLIFKFVEDTGDKPYPYDLANFIGLACSRVKNFGKTSALFVLSGGKIKRGSVRGLYDGIDYLSLFREFGFKCDGHKNAFGVTGGSLHDINLVELNNRLIELEKDYKSKYYEGRVLEVNNMMLFLQSKNVQIAEINNYVRDQYRIYIKYTGKNIKVEKRGKVYDYILDGVRVTCFDEGLSVENALILPIKERGKYIQFYMRSM